MEAPSRQVTATLKDIVSRVMIGDEQVTVLISHEDLLAHLSVPAGSDPGTAIMLTVKAKLKRCGGQNKLIIAGDGRANNTDPDPVLTKTVVRAHDWFDRLRAGQTPSQIGEANNVNGSFVTRTIRLAFLAPDITRAILDGTQPPELTADRLIQRSSEIPLDWDRQRTLLGFSS